MMRFVGRCLLLYLLTGAFAEAQVLAVANGNDTCPCNIPDENNNGNEQQQQQLLDNNDSILISMCDPNDVETCNQHCVNLHGPETVYLDDKCCIHAGKSASILAFEEDSKWVDRLAEFNKCTGASVRLDYLPEGEDGMAEALKLDVGEDTKYSDGSTGGQGIFDAYIVQAPWLPPVVEGLENLSPRIRENADIVQFLDINAASRSAVSFNGTVRALPLDTDYVAIGWRQDTFFKHGLELSPPRTIEELAELAEFLNERDHNDDGELDWGVCLTPQVNYFYAFVAPILQTKLTNEETGIPTGQNIFFDAETFEPLIRGPGFKHALEMYWRVIRASNCQEQLAKGEKCDRKSAFPTGRCPMVISMPGTLTSFILPDAKRSPKDRVDEVTGEVIWSIEDQPLGPGGTHWGRRAVFPGSEFVESYEDLDENGIPRLVSCKKAGKACANGVNYASFFAEGGEAYALNGRQSKQSTRDVMWDVFTWLSELPATQLPLSGQYRKSHLNEESKDELLQEGWPNQAVDDLFDVLGAYFKSEDEGGNPVQDLLMLGFSEYMAVLDEELHNKLFGVKVGSPAGGFFDSTDPSQSINPEEDVEIFDKAYDDFVNILEERWLLISQSMSGGVLGQLQRWRQSLSLPWKTDVELCTAAIDNIKAFRNLGCETVVNFETLCQTQPEAVAQYDNSLCKQFFGDNDSNTTSIALAIVVPVVVLLIGILILYVYVQMKQGDSVWMVKPSELDFVMVPGEIGQVPKVIGMGGFGVVQLAEYRGTKVAVKKVIPPEEMDLKLIYENSVITSSGASSDPEQGFKNPGLQSTGTHGSMMTSMNSGHNSTARQKKRSYEKLKADFVVEMRQLAKLRHPNITTVMGAVTSEEPMLLMEYMENGSLYDAIRNDTIDLDSQEDVLIIAQDIAHGLRFLHSADLIHGDLKAKNVLLDSNFRAKLSDFGLSSKTREDVARGTPYWMGPELLSGESTNCAESDIYAFGILLYELYSRKNPYEGEDYKNVLRLICDPAVSKRPPVPTLCPPNVAALIKDCWEHDPKNRPTAKDVDLMLQAEGTVQGRVFRIAALNRELLETNQQINADQAQQLTHFSSMSHEIRTPLNCVIGISSLLDEDETLTSSQKEMINMIVSSGNLLKKVVDDVLDFNKFISGNAEIEIQRTDLQETLTNILNSMALSPITEKNQITFRSFYDPLVPQYVETDTRRLQQIFFNLLSNAVKFSNFEGNVDLRVSVKVGEPKSSSNRKEKFNQSFKSLPKLRFEIVDYGKGIEKSDFEKIFQPFQQTDVGIKEGGGTGLGLAIVKQLVELLGGTISVDSKVGEWTNFMFEFPLTVSLDDKRAISSKLSMCSVLLVTNSEKETRHLIKTCEHFDVEYRHFADFKVLKANLGSSIDGLSTAFIVQEDLYDDAIYETYSKHSDRSITTLVTFGPRGTVNKGQSHYHSLTRAFPSVLIQELASMLDYASISRRLSASRLKKLPKASFEGLKVLVAEDNMINQKVMVRMLERLGVTEVTLADDGKIATEITAKETFDVIFMDMQMPVMNGLQATKIIKEREESAPQKIIFLTAHTPDDFESECRINGADYFLTKPCTIGDVRACLEKMLK